MTSLITEGGLTAVDASGASGLAWVLIALPCSVPPSSSSAVGAPTGSRRSWRPGCRGPRSSSASSCCSSSWACPIDDRAQQLTLWNWIPAGAFQLDVGLLVDPLSMTFVMLITFVGSLIHVYSIGYMEHDPEKRRGSSRTSTSSSRRCCSSSSPTPTCSSSSAGRAWAWRPTSSSASGTTTRPTRARPTRRSSSTASATSGWRSRSCSCSSPSAASTTRR